METTTVKLFKNGQSQAVRIPKAMEFKGVDEVEVVKDGDMIVLRPVRKSWLSLADSPPADDDFMRERYQFVVSGRVNFDEDDDED